MMNRFLPALLASAALSLTTLAGCSSESAKDDVETATLPPLPAPVDTTGGKKAPAPAANSVNRELNSVNATEDIKKMQQQM